MLDHQRVDQGTPGECGSYWGLGPPGSCREFPSFIDQLANIPSWVMLSNLQKENHRPQQIPAVANINQQQKWDVDSPFSSWNATPEMLEGLLHSKSYYRVQKKDGQVVPKMFVDDVPLTQILGFLHVLTWRFPEILGVPPNHLAGIFHYHPAIGVITPIYGNLQKQY